MLQYNNIYHPNPVIIQDIINENCQIKTFVLAFKDNKKNEGFSYEPGQFMMVSIPHHGEAPISFSSTPSRPGTIELSVRKAGRLTSAMHALKPGDTIALRGPFGKPFPMKNYEGHHLLFVAGGIGLAPMRGVINYCLDHRESYGSITILAGSRCPDDVSFSRDLEIWRQQKNVDCYVTVDIGDSQWTHNVGLVPSLLPRFTKDPTESFALLCGPPVMIRFVIADLVKMGFTDDHIITTMERHMKCGVGVCGHCHMDGKLVCIDGPVFSRKQLLGMDVEELQ